MIYVFYDRGVHDGAIRNRFDHGLLHISTSKWVLCTLLASQNKLLQSFYIFKKSNSVRVLPLNAGLNLKAGETINFILKCLIIVWWLYALLTPMPPCLTFLCEIKTKNNFKQGIMCQTPFR